MRRKFFFGGVILVLLCATVACNLGTSSPAGEQTSEPTIEMPTETDTALAPSAEAPTAMPPGKEYAVVLVPEGETIKVHTAAGSGSGVAGSLAWDAVDLHSTGNVQTTGGDTWVELNLPGGGTGWVDRRYLTEYMASADFCLDGRAVSLFETLYEAARTNDGRILTPIVSPVHGLTLTYIHNGNPKLYDPAQAGMVFGSSEIVDWGLGPGSGLPVQGTFEDLVRPDILAVFASAETHCNAIQLGGASYTVTWPSLWKNVNFYSVYKPGSPGTEMDWITWLAGVEYVDGLPYLFSLSRYNWEP